MKYTSTRDDNVRVGSARAVIDGISADGGLYVPLELPKIDFVTLGDDYFMRAERVLSVFFDFDVKGITERAYSTFDGDPAPVVKIDDDLFVLELWHGKTCAFKDMALSVLPSLLVNAKAYENENDETLVLVATSGDTGKAALEGFKDVAGTRVCVFYPTDGVSRVQKLAMMTQDGQNVCSVGIRGNFDDAQSAVKRAFADESLTRELKAENIVLSSANSINIGRLVPQIAYYFSAYADLVDCGEIKTGERIDFVVPTGNFGNILAGYYAKQMGLPIEKLVCASNRNNVLTDFINTGVYDINRKFHKTDSPSMDILISSNLERLLFETSGRDAALTAQRMSELKQTGRYTVTAAELKAIRETFDCGFASDEACADAIYDMFDEYGYLIDPHTAAAYAVAKSRGYKRKTVVVSTANPYKFAPAVLKAIGAEVGGGEVTVKTLERLCDETAMEIPTALAEVFDKPVRFDAVIDKSEIIDYIKNNYHV